MSAPSLRELEQSLVTLWTDRSQLKRALEGKKCDLPLEIVKGIDHRVSVYTRLLEIGQNELLRSIYPYCAQLLRGDWERTVRDYISHYPPKHFNLNRAGQKFAHYLDNEGSKLLVRFPYLNELADYEWIELELLERDEEVEVKAFAELDSPEKFAQFTPWVNPLLILRTYEYPLTALIAKLDARKRIPSVIKRKSTYIAAFRNPETNHCTYLELGQRAFELVATAQAKEQSFADLIAFAVAQQPAADPHETVAEILDLLDEFKEQNLFIGTRKIGQERGVK